MDIEASASRVTRRSDGEVFLRQQHRSVRLDREQVLALEHDKNQRRFEDEVCEYSGIDDMDEEAMDRSRAKLGTDATTEQMLRSHVMPIDGQLTNAGALLFSRNPTQFIPCARVRFLRIEGARLKTGSRMNIVEGHTFDGPIPKAIEDAKATISSQLREFLATMGSSRSCQSIQSSAGYASSMRACSASTTIWLPHSCMNRLRRAGRDFNAAGT